jgi:hypothetical protein
MMEESREPQRSISTTVVVPPAYPLQQPAYYAPAPAARPSLWLQFRRMIRLLLVRLIRGLMSIGRVLRPFALILAVSTVLLGVIAWLSILLWWPETASTNTAVDQRVAALPPASSVESYMKGRQSYNADMMWDAFSAEFQASQLETGASKSTMQAQANRERMVGLKYDRYEYIGGVQLDGGGGMYFYAVNLSYQDQQLKLPMVFTADADGKIERISLPGQSQSQ